MKQSWWPFGYNKKVHDIKNKVTPRVQQLDREKEKLRRELLASQQELEKIAYRLGVSAGRIEQIP